LTPFPFLTAGLNISAPAFSDYLKVLGQAADVRIASFESLCAALKLRFDHFSALGCIVTDHSMRDIPFREAANADETERIFRRILDGATVNGEEEEKYVTGMLKFLAGEYHRRGWVMQIRVGSFKSNNTRMSEKLGPDTGYDSMGDYPIADKLLRLLNAMDYEGILPKTIIFSLNPKDNYVIGAAIGCFQSPEAESKMQFGTAWWFNDHRDGMVEHMKALANLGLLSKFVGMVTDSRSFLSYTRHEYFRRILCNLIGGWVENGEYPADYEILGEIVEGICYNNAVKYFGV